MRTLAWVLAVTMLLGAVAVVVACGDDDDDGTTPTPGTIDVVLIFPKVTDTGFDFVETTRSVPADQAGPEQVMDLLLAGPTSEEESSLEVINPFPDNVEVLSVDVSDDTATVDFSAEMLDYGGGAANVEAITGSITRTLQEATAAGTVEILVEGEPDQLQP